MFTGENCRKRKRDHQPSASTGSSGYYPQPRNGLLLPFLACDELVVAYNTRVARSKKITGTYLGIDEQDITTGAECWPMLTHRYQFHEHHGWVAISHWAVFQNPESEQ